jgi:Uma2 family endonuclease
MTLSASPLKTEIFYPHSDGKPMAESDPARDYLVYSVDALDLYFQNQADVYVSGNLFIYYKKNVPDAVIAPDVFVVFGVEKKKRMSYKVWEENNKVPGFVLEVTSKTTQEQDESEKPQKYQKMGVLEYFQYDPTGDYLKPPLKGLRLIEGQYQPIVSNRLSDETVAMTSESLGLELHLSNGVLRFYDPQTQKKLLSHSEMQKALQQEIQMRKDAVPRLLELGLSVEQIAASLGLSEADVRTLSSV